MSHSKSKEDDIAVYIRNILAIRPHWTNVTNYWAVWQTTAVSHHAHSDTIQKNHNNRFMALCQWLPEWVGSKRNIHPPILLISHPLSTMIHSIFPAQITCLTVFLHNLSPSPLWSTFCSGTLCFILYTFLHQVIVFPLQYMPMPSQPVLLQYWDFTIYSYSRLQLLTWNYLLP